MLSKQIISILLSIMYWSFIILISTLNAEKMKHNCNKRKVSLWLENIVKKKFEILSPKLNVQRKNLFVLDLKELFPVN